MRITSINKLKPGDVLGKSLFNDNADLLLASGYRLDAAMISLIMKSGIKYVFVLDELSEDVVPEDVISDTIRATVTRSLVDSYRLIKENPAFRNLQPEAVRERLEKDTNLNNLINVANVRSMVTQLLEEIVEQNVSMFTALPVSSQTPRDHEHALDTTLLSLLIAQKLNTETGEMRALGTAALVHDVGKMAFPSIHEKPAEDLSPEERAILREHPTISMLILRGSSQDTFREQATVLQHHELQNGSGYPLGLRGSGHKPVKMGDQKISSKFIFRLAEILGVANHFDNLIRGDFDGFIYSAEDAVTRIIQESGEMWNEYVTKALLRVVQCYPAGVTVRILENSSRSYVGYTGIIAQSNTQDPTKPIIILTHNTTGAPIVPKRVNFHSEKSMNLELIV